MLDKALRVGLALAVMLPCQLRAAPRVGDSAPKVTAVTLDGAAFDLSRLRGHVVVVNLWATWCGPCRAEMPALDAVYRRLHGQGLEMIGLSEDRPRDVAKVRAVMAAFGYPAATADKTRADQLADPPSLPMTYLIDRAGKVRAVLSGNPPLTEASLRGALAGPLAETPPR